MLGVLAHIPLGQLPEFSNRELAVLGLTLILLSLAAWLGKKWWG